MLFCPFDHPHCFSANLFPFCLIRCKKGDLHCTRSNTWADSQCSYTMTSRPQVHSWHLSWYRLLGIPQWSSLLCKWLFSPNSASVTILDYANSWSLIWNTTIIFWAMTSLYKSFAHCSPVHLSPGFWTLIEHRNNRWRLPGMYPQASWHRCRIFTS